MPMQKTRDAELLALDRKLRSCSTDILRVLAGSFVHSEKPEPEVIALVKQVLREREIIETNRKQE